MKPVALYRIAIYTAAAGIAALGCAGVGAQTPPVPPAGSATTGEAQPGTQAQRQASQQFVDQAASANRAEIQEGRYVVNHTSSAAVRRFAQKMIHDHAMSLDQLKQIASSEGLKVPAGLSKKDRSSFDKLSHDNGARLDMVYSAAQERDHQQVIAKFRKAATESDLLPAIRDYASKTLPTLQEHLHMAQQLVATESKGNHSAG
jgi:putative membrane protein